MLFPRIRRLLHGDDGFQSFNRGGGEYVFTIVLTSKMCLIVVGDVVF